MAKPVRLATFTPGVPQPALDPVRMIEEYARHAGHADLLGESVDGATGE